MFSRKKLLLSFSIYKNLSRNCQNKAVQLDSFLLSIKDLPPKQGYSPVFFDRKVQKILHQISGIDLEKVFRVKPSGEKLRDPIYKFATTEELEAELEKAKKKAKYLLQIPPVINISEDNIEVLDSDTTLDGYDEHHSKLVVTDVSLSETNEERLILVREPNGILRTASKNERFRMNQIYNPIPKRELEIPQMFDSENLINVIKRKEYEFILDRACVQFEPDDVLYHNVIGLTYEAINFCEDFEMLQSTRHFGSLVFYLVTHQSVDNLLNFYLLNDRIEDAYSLIKLYYIIHPKCNSSERSSGEIDLEALKNFIEFESKSKDKLSHSLNTFLRKEESKKELESRIKEAHGI